MTVENASVLRAIDRAAFAVALADLLRRAGVPVDLTATQTFSRALSVCAPADRSRLYWLARVCLVRDPHHLAGFDATFAAVFADAVLAVDPHARRRSTGAVGADAMAGLHTPGSAVPEQTGLPWVTRPAISDSPAGPTAQTVVPERLPSTLAGLADTPFDELDPAQLEALGSWLEASLDAWPVRRTRRLSRQHSGRYVDLRATMARARRTAWEPAELVRTGPVFTPRRLVMLCDVSQSMQAFTSTYLHLMRAAALSHHGEVFAFATSLTRLTPVLVHRSAPVAMAKATELVTDRFGGTRIASSLRELLGSRHGSATRGAVVLIASDGWDSEDPAALAAAMARLRRRAFRVIWMNPRAAAAGFAPLTGAMAAALPYCDELLPGDTLRAVGRVLEVSSRA
ncbi:MAG TPA: VWA domain-containing protein [Kribbellaceae bacterium]|nr:VWA domain-containing protein [Kribbellaceae bacterium]